jgi:chloride channel 3/4/5
MVRHVHFDEVASSDVRKSFPYVHKDGANPNQDNTRAGCLRASKNEFHERESVRRTQLDEMRTSLVEVLQHGQRRAARKKSLSKWKQFKTVSVHWDELEDHKWMHHNAIQRESCGNLAKRWQDLLSWVIPAAIGFLTAASGSLIEKGVQWLGDVRFGYCHSARFFVSMEACDGEWFSWASMASNYNVFLYVSVSVFLATTSAILVWAFAPEARGSGIPEVKTILGGFVMAKVLDARTLVVKIFGLCLSCSSGLSLGKEGPLVHVACCWANTLSRFSSRYTKNETKRRELISTAAAAGVSVAFGAPLGGVLFAFEEVSTMFPSRTMIRAFFAAVVAALSLDIMNPNGSSKLTLFQTSYVEPPALLEYAWFLILGVLGGCIGSVFVHCNIKVSAARADGSRWRKNVPIVFEVTLIAICTAVTSFPMIYTRRLPSEIIRSLFHRCDGDASSMPDMMGLCDGLSPAVSLELAQTLLLSALARFTQMIFTFGTGVPCGLFVPSLYTGACLGRVAGMLSHSLSEHFGLGIVVYPGMYAMVGAAAVLGGVCRVTISLVVIMFELTGGLQLIMPFMLAVLVAKWVGDCFTGGIYDCCLVLRGYPFLHEPEDITFTKRACDIMDTRLDCITAEPIKISELLKDVQSSKYNGFPLIQSHQDHTILGYIHSAKLLQYLQNETNFSSTVGDSTKVAFAKYVRPNEAEGVLDLSDPSLGIIDEGAIHVVPDTPLGQVHNIFRQLGVNLVLVSRFGKLVGIITKKSFLHHLHEGHIGDMKRDPVVTTDFSSSKIGIGLEESFLV